jgi:hypothetical protein
LVFAGSREFGCAEERYGVAVSMTAEDAVLADVLWWYADRFFAKTSVVFRANVPVSARPGSF